MKFKKNLRRGHLSRRQLYYRFLVNLEYPRPFDDTLVSLDLAKSMLDLLSSLFFNIFYEQYTIFKCNIRFFYTWKFNG